MKRILYLMHLPWDWIKQRPHFLAEELSSLCPVEVVYRFYRVPFEGKLVRNPRRQSLQVRPVVILPFNRFAPVAALNGLLLRAYLRRCIARFDVVWFTHPEMFEAVGCLLLQRRALVLNLPIRASDHLFPAQPGDPFTSLVPLDYDALLINQHKTV